MKKIIATSLVLIMAPLLFLKVASAQLLTNTEDPNGLTQITDTVAAQANLGQVDAGVLVAKIIQVFLGLLAIIFLILMVVAGFRWMTAVGNEELIKKAQGTIKTAIIGLLVVLVSYSITYFVLRYLPFGGGVMPNPV